MLTTYASSLSIWLKLVGGEGGILTHAPVKGRHARQVCRTPTAGEVSNSPHRHHAPSFVIATAASPRCCHKAVDSREIKRMSVDD
jgi:hypothetical protein